MRRFDLGRGLRMSRVVLSWVAVIGMLSVVTEMSRAETPKPRLKVAIVGLEHGHVEGFLAQLSKHSDVELVGIADADSALLSKYQKKYSLPETLFFKSMANMIEVRMPQAVLVYTPISEHRHTIEIAAQYGVSVMVEKPLTISYEDALAIRKVAREHHIHVLVNYETTWYASNRAAYEEVASGRIGEVRRVVVHDGHQGPKEISVPPEFLKWLTDPAQNGAGALYDFGCYGVDLMTWLMHGEVPLTVTAVVNHDKPQLYKNVDDDATIVLTYPHAQAVIQASWNWPFGRKDMEVYGATGYAITVAADQVRIRHEHDSAEQLTPARPLEGVDADSLSYLTAVLGNFITPMGDEPTPVATSGSHLKRERDGELSALDTNVVVMQILDAARESARTGKSVKLK
jgi:predicted dehydrogenase